MNHKCAKLLTAIQNTVNAKPDGFIDIYVMVLTVYMATNPLNMLQFPSENLKPMNVWVIGILVLTNIRLIKWQFCVYHCDTESHHHSLTNTDQVTHTYVCRPSHHRSNLWLVAYSATSYYLNQHSYTVKWTIPQIQKISRKLETIHNIHFQSGKCF